MNTISRMAIVFVASGIRTGLNDSWPSGWSICSKAREATSSGRHSANRWAPQHAGETRSMRGHHDQKPSHKSKQITYKTDRLVQTCSENRSPWYMCRATANAGSRIGGSIRSASRESGSSGESRGRSPLSIPLVPPQLLAQADHLDTIKTRTNGTIAWVLL